MNKLLNIDEVHSLLLEMLKAIDSYCRDNNIKYALAYGTLLGAVRHKGFIPWDDDIDIYMSRPDFERFIQEFKHERYQVLYCANEKDAYFYHFMAKVHDTKTVSIEKKVRKYKFGINLDIFPVDGKPDTIEEQRKHERACRKVANRMYLRLLPFFNKKYKPIFALLESRLHSAEWWQKKCETMMKKYPYATSKYCGSLSTQNYTLRQIFDKDMYDTLTEYEFEGCKFFGLKRAHEYLTQMYGDYMILPPENQRKIHSMAVFMR